MSTLLAKKVVLVVEDDFLVRTFVADVLEDEGFEVIEAADADKALVLLRTRADVLALVTDVEMPGSLNGYELARIVHERLPNISIIVTSGRSWPRQNDMPARGVFLSKPVSAEKLAAQVKQAIDQAEAKFGTDPR